MTCMKKTLLSTIKINILLSCLLWIISYGLTSCKREKIDVASGTPDCVKDKITQETKDHTCLSNVYEYDYQDKKVYLFMHDCPDAGDILYNSECTIICTIGGISGEIHGPCSDFEQQRLNERSVWER